VAADAVVGAMTARRATARRTSRRIFMISAWRRELPGRSNRT
jgi:hypothetical protein